MHVFIRHNIVVSKGDAACNCASYICFLFRPVLYLMCMHAGASRGFA